MSYRPHCPHCGTAHEPTAHFAPAAMEREAAKRIEAGDALGAAIWRARAACTRSGRVLGPAAGQLAIEPSTDRRTA